MQLSGSDSKQRMKLQRRRLHLHKQEKKQRRVQVAPQPLQSFMLGFWGKHRNHTPQPAVLQQQRKAGKATPFLCFLVDGRGRQGAAKEGAGGRRCGGSPEQERRDHAASPLKHFGDGNGAPEPPREEALEKQVGRPDGTACTGQTPRTRPSLPRRRLQPAVRTLSSSPSARVSPSQAAMSWRCAATSSST